MAMDPIAFEIIVSYRKPAVCRSAVAGELNFDTIEHTSPR